MHNYASELAQYRWQLRNLQSKEAFRRKIVTDIDEGIASVDVLCEDWLSNLDHEIREIRIKLDNIKQVIDTIPETKSMLPCKIYLNLRYIAGYSLTDISGIMGVSLSTLRRIDSKSQQYLNTLPMFENASEH